MCSGKKRLRQNLQNGMLDGLDVAEFSQSQKIDYVKRMYSKRMRVLRCRQEFQFSSKWTMSMQGDESLVQWNWGQIILLTEKC